MCPAFQHEPLCKAFAYPVPGDLYHVTSRGNARQDIFHKLQEVADGKGSGLYI